MPKIYIAGPMTGLPNFNRDSFHKASDYFTSKGYSVLNPATLPDGLTSSEYMDICVAMVRCADQVYFLEGWQKSAGAQAEYHLAVKLEKQIRYQEIQGS